MRLRALLSLLVLAGASPAAAADLDSLLRGHRADDLVAPLTAFESAHRGEEGAAAAYLLGQLRYARGEYRPAADAFARAAAGFEPSRKPEARYWTGLAYLGVRDGARARAALEEVASSTHARRLEARLALAHVWEMEKRPDQALALLEPFAEEGPSEATPAALERLVALADAMGRDPLAKRARVRLQRDYPGTIEAARLAPAPVESPSPAAAPTAVEVGRFSDPERARALADKARRAGFPAAAVLSRGAGTERLWTVRLGAYASAAEARAAGERAAAALGAAYRLVRTR